METDPVTDSAALAVGRVNVYVSNCGKRLGQVVKAWRADAIVIGK